MGCDIHMFPESKCNGYWGFRWKAAPSGYWTERYAYPPPDRDNYFAMDDRWYWFFGQLAGVRREGPPIAEPRGLPEDVSYDVKEWMEDSDYHSRSWLTLAELQNHPWNERHDGTVEVQSIEKIKAWLERLAELDPDPNNVRIVFAFDN